MSTFATNMNFTLNEILFAISSLGASIGTFIIGRRGRTKDLDSKEIKNLSDIIKIQGDAVKFFKEELEDLRGQFNKLQDEFEICRKKLMK